MKVKIPQDLNEISLGQMMELTRVDKLEIEDLDKAKMIIKLLVENVNDHNIDRVKVSDLLVMYRKLCEMTNEQIQLMKFVSLEGKKYGFNPDLNNISTGEFMDIDTLCKDLDKNLHLIMAILYREVSTEGEGKYLIKPYDANIEARARMFKEKMPASVAQSCLVFFYNLGSEYLKSTLESLQEDQPQSQQQDLERSGVGTLS
tara:strand:+ start:6511 stop:7116 length:606 start_codon:yes stop_codon:yes gene_type:complete